MILDSFISYILSNLNIAYAMLFAGAFIETLVPFSFFIPGEIVFLSGSILAGMGTLNIWIVSIVCIAGGLIGDNTNYFTGKHLGKRAFKMNKWIFNKKNESLISNLFNKYGAKIVFFARFMGPISWITPFFAGISGMNYKTFVKYNTPAVILGISQFLLIGYLLGYSYKVMLTKIKIYIGIIAVILIISFFLASKLKIAKVRNLDDWKKIV